MKRCRRNNVNTSEELHLGTMCLNSDEMHWTRNNDS